MTSTLKYSIATEIMLQKFDLYVSKWEKYVKHNHSKQAYYTHALTHEYLYDG